MVYPQSGCTPDLLKGNIPSNDSKKNSAKAPKVTSCELERIGYLRNLPLDKLRGTSLSNSNYPPQNCQLAPENGWLGDDPFILGPLGLFSGSVSFFQSLFHLIGPISPQQESLPFRDDRVNWKNRLIIGLSISSLSQSNKSWIQFGDTGG